MCQFSQAAGALHSGTRWLAPLRRLRGIGHRRRFSSTHRACIARGIWQGMVLFGIARAILRTRGLLLRAVARRCVIRLRRSAAALRWIQRVRRCGFLGVASRRGCGGGNGLLLPIVLPAVVHRRVGASLRGSSAIYSPAPSSGRVLSGAKRARLLTISNAGVMLGGLSRMRVGKQVPLSRSASATQRTLPGMSWASCARRRAARCG